VILHWPTPPVPAWRASKTMQESPLSWSWCGLVKQPNRERMMRMCRRRPPHVLHERNTHPLEAQWAAMFEGSCALGECLCRAARRVTVHFNIMEAGAEIFKDFTNLRGKRNLMQ
jgi:hypothetical protein